MIFWRNPEILKKSRFSNSNNLKDKICIIIPARNEDTITKTLESIKIQKYNYLEILVINDNSTDDFRENNFKKSLERFHY